MNPLREAPKSTPCVCCAAPSEVEVWGCRVCYPCHSAWNADERFNSGAVNAACGIDSRAIPEPGDAAKYCAEATRRTRAWVAERTRRAA